MKEQAGARHAGLAAGGEMPEMTPLTASSMLGIAETILGDLPPSSSETRLNCRAAAS